MKTIRALTVSALCVMTLAAAPGAFANETAEACRAYMAANNPDADASGCDCLGEAAAENPELAAAVAAISTPADVEAADDATKAAIGACFPAA